MAKIKLKTNRAIAKRLRLTGSGKLKRAQANKGHILTKKSAKRKIQLRKKAYVSATIHKKMISVLHNN